MTALLSESRARVAWGGVTLLCLALSYGVAADGRVVVLAAGVAALVIAIVVAGQEPRWAVVAIAFGSYATLFEAAQTATGLPLSKRLVVVVMVALIVWRRAGGVPLPVPARRDVVLVTLTLAVVTASSVVAVDRATTLGQLPGLVTAAAIALLISTLSEPRWLARAMWSVALAGGALAAIALHQQLTGSYGTTYFGLATVEFDAGVIRSGGPFEPNFFAQALVVSTALAAYLALRARHVRERVVGVAVALLCVAGIAGTASRGGTLALAAMLGLFLLLRRPRVRVLIPVAVLVFAIGSVVLPPETTKRVSSLAAATDVQQSIVHDTSFRGRFAENVTAVYMLRDNPLLGVGSGNFPVRYAEYSTYAGREWRPVRQPHNLYLEAFAETGVIGGTMFLVFLGLTISGAWRARRLVSADSTLLVEGIFVALIGLLTTSLFLHAAYISTFWAVIGLAWAAAATGRSAVSRIAGA